MEKISHLISEAIKDKKWKALRMGKDGPWISHLMFAYDLLLIGEAKKSQMRCIMDILEYFNNILGARS